jgi:glyoxylase-like metal-dependent hydrolase (beta-lactamase superfamily II)
MVTRVAGQVGRRWFLAQAGRGAVSVAVLGLAACSGAGQRAGGTTTSAGPTPADPTSAAPTSAGPTSAGSPSALAWSRVDLGPVAAYVLVRGREAAVVDTGVGSSADEIGAVLDQAGPGWAGVRHVVLTHKHPDHAGSIGDVLARATAATGYAGAADLPDVDAPRPLRPLQDGDDVFGLQVVGTPGHTAGHVAVFDAGTGVLVAGDALTNTAGLNGSNPQFTQDEAAATASVRTLAGLAPRTILVGHGGPVTDGAAAALSRLAASLG